MKRYPSFCCVIGLQLVIAAGVAAQSKNPTNTLKVPPADVKIDGDLKDWGDSLRYYNEEKKLNYTLANDKDNLYMAIRFNDRSEKMRVLGAGITFSIDTKGKKKDTYTLTYPVVTPGEGGQTFAAMRKPTTEGVSQEDRDELTRERLTKLHNIKVSGFKDIEGDMITTSNTYGIKVAINYDADGFLVYEATIPLKFFGDFKIDKEQWAFNFKINALAKPENGGGEHPTGGMRGGGGGMGGGGMRGGGGGMGGGRRGGGGMRGGAPGGENATADRGDLFKSVDFWEKFYLRN
jgi:hypothetical protein